MQWCSAIWLEVLNLTHKSQWFEPPNVPCMKQDRLSLGARQCLYHDVCTKYSHHMSSCVGCWWWVVFITLSVKLFTEAIYKVGRRSMHHAQCSLEHIPSPINQWWMHKAWKWGLVCVMLIIAMFCSRYLFNFNDLFCYFITHFLGDYRCTQQLLWGRISDSYAENKLKTKLSIRYVYTSWSLCDVLFDHCTWTEWIAPSE